MVATADDDADADADDDTVDEDGGVSHGWIKPASSACTSNSSSGVGTDGDEEGSGWTSCAVSGAVVSVTVAVVELSAASRF